MDFLFFLKAALKDTEQGKYHKLLACPLDSMLESPLVVKVRIQEDPDTELVRVQTRAVPADTGMKSPQTTEHRTTVWSLAYTKNLG